LQKKAVSGGVMMSESVWNAETLLKTSGVYWEACTLHAGVKLGIFTHLGDAHCTAKDIATKIGADERAVTMLLNALAAMGLLSKEDDLYGNTTASKTFLNKTSPHYLGYLIVHHSLIIHSWAELSQAVKSGKPLRKQPYDAEEEREGFLMGMFNMAMASAPHIAEQIDLSDRRHLLDLGGGPGTHAIHFCRVYPQLRATVFDLPATEPFALRIIRQFELEDRVDFMAGNYIEEDLKGSYDVAWLSHILHGEGPKGCQRIINNTVSVMKPGGLLLVHDFILEDTLDRPLFPALFALNMLINTPQGQSYSEAQITTMLLEAGVKKIKRLPFQGPNDAGIICGVV
jgi:predicted O-methyltransferase YrrM